MPARALRLAFRRLALALRRPNVDLVVPDTQVHLPGRIHDPFRASRILAFLDDERLLRRRRLHRPAAASLATLRRVHDDAYLERLERPGALTHAVGMRLPDRNEQRVLEVQRSMVGGTILAARLARASGGLAVNLGGGLHHAHRDRGAGFCLYNDVAVAIAELRAEGFDGRVIVVDLDLHDGDGTRSLFAQDATVHTFSIHGAPWDEETGVESTSLALGSGVDDERFAAALEPALPPLLDRYRPALAFYLAGADVARDDALGDWKLTARGILERDEFVLRELRRRGVPRVFLLAGGYGDDAWRYPARSIAQRIAGFPIEPPSTSELVLDRFRTVALQIAPASLSGRDAGDELFSAEDLGALGVHAPETRFLGFYTRAGIELALERLGYLERLRQLGYERPRLEIDLANPSGHTLRVFGSPGRRELLVELRCAIDRSSLPEFQLLRVEWLLLQNPRGLFTRDRPPLPGQTHPGLGMLRETIAALVLVCDRLKLDGILVVASRYHPAASAHGELRCLDPDDEARLRSLARALEGVSRAEAARLAEGGGLVDAVTGETISFRPMTMVLPISEALVARFDSAEYRARARAGERVLRRSGKRADGEPSPGSPAG